MSFVSFLVVIKILMAKAQEHCLLIMLLCFCYTEGTLNTGQLQ